ncbi:MAG TPA: hypothetical protein DEF43_03850 [Chloroflexus aurantiacus]|jgi:hypothetical protein|uniref:Uncharacterized protein n=1 Tax=Chloroflexus aurantiacus (strain ATCC 29366 / DSM 635 / J-10-fl) TaxID=324602 RepID=A9WF62_CHLAA|nr:MULTISPECIES: hypothetical protein [Chloroflexus]ABY35377.1 conserved hypothetical protein; putative signal peptide [Chloroflexus aurantiacus J-10-fl]RMG51862.1 MAG: hypothetical protein D6716_04990 [Chloroflexota bacterium]GIV92200.1 MAG: hypothetical protein KatS3mg056_0909 [Chloroflexus sp.]HBW66291.1 hypothetical protein [Chloroflexus aurantiacus]
MTTFPRSPRLLKGALVSFDLPNPQPAVIIFQYNPDTLSRTLEAQTGSEGSDALRIKGAPVETIKLDVELDATDQLEQGGAALGLHPQLAALEVLIYPKSSLVVANTTLLNTGTIEILPPQAPFTLFIWGPKRVLPVRLTEFSISEEAHDPQLNPIRAKVSLGLRVLSYNDLPLTNPGYHLFLAHQIVKETMAATARSSSLDATGAGSLSL